MNEDPVPNATDVLTLATLRSHDQYNTTIYGLNDRYREISGRRDIVFVNQSDLDSRGLKSGDPVDLEACGGSGTPARVLSCLTAVAYDIPAGSVGAYYPEANVLISLKDYDARSGTPAFKSVAVRLRASTA